MGAPSAAGADPVWCADAGGGRVRRGARLAVGDGAGAARDLAKLSILALVEAFTAALDEALARERAGRADLSRWGEWLVMAATLTLLRSRLLLPKNAPEAWAAQDEAEALRRLLLGRAAIRRAAEWLDRNPQLGRDVFARGGGENARAASRSTDITDLFRACLVALRVPEQAEAYQHRIPFWRVSDAIARITRMLDGQPGGGALALFLPRVEVTSPQRELRCRTALASTFLAGLELAREGTAELEQHRAWHDILVRGHQRQPIL